MAPATSAAHEHILIAIYQDASLACPATSLLWKVQEEWMIFSLASFLVVEMWWWFLNSVCSSWNQTSIYLFYFIFLYVMHSLSDMCWIYTIIVISTAVIFFFLTLFPCSFWKQNRTVNHQKLHEMQFFCFRSLFIR